MAIAVFHNHPIHYKHLLFREMNKRGLDFTVFFFGAGSDIRHEEISLSSELYRYQIGFEGLHQDAPLSSRVRFAWKSLGDGQADLVIISGMQAAECWVSWLWARLFGRPVILWYECNRFDGKRIWWKEQLKRLFLKGCERVHVYGASNKSYVASLGIDPDRVDGKRAVIDCEKFSLSSEAKRYSEGVTKRIVFVGRLAPEKNVTLLLEAVSSANQHLGRTVFKLTVVGAGSLERDLRISCSRLQIDNIVEFVGFCPQAE